MRRGEPALRLVFADDEHRAATVYRFNADLGHLTLPRAGGVPLGTADVYIRA